MQLSDGVAELVEIGIVQCGRKPPPEELDVVVGANMLVEVNEPPLRANSIAWWN